VSEEIAPKDIIAHKHLNGDRLFVADLVGTRASNKFANEKGSKCGNLFALASLCLDVQMWTY
jgi:hypothetical protein